MFLTKKVWSADLVDPRQRDQGRDVSGRMIGQLTIFFVSWFVTYNKAYLAGDDVNTFQASGYGVSIFLPKPAPGWTPNRVVDLYGRDLLRHVFDLVYFPAKSLFGADFFFVFKIFNATLFAIFLCVVYRYLVDQIFVQEGALRGERQKRDVGILSSLFIAFVTLSIVPWITEVEMVCYQIPAFICFVVLAELLKLMPRFSAQGQVGIPVPWLMTLCFVAAFSLEAYSAIILAVMVGAWVWNRPWRSRKVWRGPAFIVSCLLAVYCVAALLVTVLYAQRPDSTEKFSITKQIGEFFFANKSLSSRCQDVLCCPGCGGACAAPYRRVSALSSAPCAEERNDGGLEFSRVATTLSAALDAFFADCSVPNHDHYKPDIAGNGL